MQEEAHKKRNKNKPLHCTNRIGMLILSDKPAVNLKRDFRLHQS